MKILLVAAVSADGFIAQAADQNSLEWTSKEDTKFFVEKSKEAGVVVMGRKTFDTIGKGLKGRRVIVMTRQQGLRHDNPGVEYTNLSPKDLVAQLQTEGVEQLLVAGGSAIYRQFMEEGLVTDLFLTIEPILFGHGVPLCTLAKPQRFSLGEMRQLGEQTVLLHYIA
ncbi:MAG: dihydrofolate reductase family protein [bacterium]|jgi:dihydrofolate reductase|nr:dihydrofolate reductase family protein [bacterium]